LLCGFNPKCTSLVNLWFLLVTNATIVVHELNQGGTWSRNFWTIIFVSEPKQKNTNKQKKSDVIDSLPVWRYNTPKTKSYNIFLIHEMNNAIYWEQIQQICQNRKLIAVLGAWCPSMLRIYACVLCSISLLSVYMCVRMPISLRSIAGVPSPKQINPLMTKYMIHD